MILHFRWRSLRIVGLCPRCGGHGLSWEVYAFMVFGDVKGRCRAVNVLWLFDLNPDSILLGCLHITAFDSFFLLSNIALYRKVDLTGAIWYYNSFRSKIYGVSGLKSFKSYDNAGSRYRKMLFFIYYSNGSKQCLEINI